MRWVSYCSWETHAWNYLEMFFADRKPRHLQNLQRWNRQYIPTAEAPPQSPEILLYLSMYLSTYLSFYLSIYLSIWFLKIYPTADKPPICPTVETPPPNTWLYRFIYVSFVSIHIFLVLYIYLHIYICQLESTTHGKYLQSIYRTTWKQKDNNILRVQEAGK